MGLIRQHLLNLVVKFLSESLEKMLLAVGKPSMGKIIDEELPIAKKLRAHIN